MSPSNSEALWNPDQRPSRQTMHRWILTAPVSLLSDALAQPQWRFWATNCIGEGISCRNSHLLKCKQALWSHDMAHSWGKFAPILTVLETVRSVFQDFFFLSQSGSDHKNDWGWEVLFTRRDWAEKLKVTFSETLGWKAWGCFFWNLGLKGMRPLFFWNLGLKGLRPIFFLNLGLKGLRPLFLKPGAQRLKAAFSETWGSKA